MLGAGRSLGRHGDVLGLSLYDLFHGSLGMFVGLGLLFVAIIVFPRCIRDAASSAGRAARTAQQARRGAAGGAARGHRPDSHESFVAFNSRKRVAGAALGHPALGARHANKLLAGYVALRALGIQANFVDVLLLQTMITFLLYFAPTPGGLGHRRAALGRRDVLGVPAAGSWPRSTRSSGGPSSATPR